MNTISTWFIPTCCSLSVWEMKCNIHEAYMWRSFVIRRTQSTNTEILYLLTIHLNTVLCQFVNICKKMQIWQTEVYLLIVKLKFRIVYMYSLVKLVHCFINNVPVYLFISLNSENGKAIFLVSVETCFVHTRNT